MAAIDPDIRREQRDVVARLAQLGFVLPGTITERTMRCGKQRCGCANDPAQRHGPYTQWTRTIDGKTVTKMLNRDQHARYQAWFDDHRQLRDLTSELETLSIQAIIKAEGWGS
ncbi:MAG: DUF6788 family protein [Streptosporangiaceae bacterium]